MAIIESIEVLLYAFVHVAWPIALYSLGFMFRDAIRSLFTRVSEISVGQNTLNLRAEAQQQTESGSQAFSAKGGLTDVPPQERDLETYDRLMTFDASETRDFFERILEEDLAENNLTDEQWKKVLIRHLAHTQMISEFRLISMAVFGSQIDLLSRLNENFPIGMKHEAVRNFYDSVRATYAQQFDSWDLKTYLWFLVEYASLVRLEDDRLHITDKGREYLIWRIEHSLAKPGC